MKGGKVYLVGAGPGDPRHLTLAALECLQHADCVVHDRLIDPRVLALASPDAELINVGKTGGSHYVPQETINQLLIDRARAGQRVVRLKGGDPLLFARGGEEALALADAGIPFEVAPGVTAALAAAATAAIPLTHRDLASAVCFVTGHEDPTKEGARLDWQSIAKFPGTIVVYMGLTRIGSIASELMAQGKDPKSPTVVVEWGGSNRQKTARRTLDELRGGPPPGIASPALVVIGDVANLRDALGWFERRPLHGQQVMVLRAAEQIDAMASRLESLGAVVTRAPAFAIEPADAGPLDAALARPSTFDWIVFSSRNGVRAFAERLAARGRDGRALGGARLAAIGTGTADELAGFHLKADLIPETFNAEALVEALGRDAGGRRILVIRADRGRTLVADELTKRGDQVETIVAYRQIDASPPEGAIDELRQGAIGWVMLSSSAMARSFFAWLDDDLKERVRAEVKLVSISPLTSAAIREAGFAVELEARVYTPDGMIDALVDRLTRS